MSVYRPTYRDPKTGKQKQSATWWYGFTFAGQRIQESAKTTRKTIAKQAEENRRLELEKAYAGIPSEKPERRIRTVSIALAEYETSYAPNHRPKAIAWVKERTAHINRLLGNLLIHDLNESRMAEYMKDRLREDGTTVGEGKKKRTVTVSRRTVNMECECLARAIGHPWRILWPKLKRLGETRDKGQALSPAQEKDLLTHAANNKSPFLLPFIRIALLTGMRLGEIRRLRWSQIDLEKCTLTVGISKTAASTGRAVPMNVDLYSTFATHASWLAEKLGPIEPNWYVFPFSKVVLPVDPHRPVTGIKSAWETAREKAGLTLRFHDLRHTAYTKLVEAGVPDGVIMALMGHVSRQMVERYSHVRMDAMKQAVEKLSLSGPANRIAPTKESTKVAKSATAH